MRDLKGKLGGSKTFKSLSRNFFDPNHHCRHLPPEFNASLGFPRKETCRRWVAVCSYPEGSFPGAPRDLQTEPPSLAERRARCGDARPSLHLGRRGGAHHGPWRTCLQGEACQTTSGVGACNTHLYSWPTAGTARPTAGTRKPTAGTRKPAARTEDGRARPPWHWQLTPADTLGVPVRRGPAGRRRDAVPGRHSRTYHGHCAGGGCWAWSDLRGNRTRTCRPPEWLRG